VTHSFTPVVGDALSVQVVTTGTVIITPAAKIIAEYGVTGGGGGSGALTLITTTTLGVAASSVTFSAIPGTYTNLQLVITARGDTGASQISPTIQFNGDTGNNYYFSYILGNGGTAVAGNGGPVSGAAIGAFPAASSVANITGTMSIGIPLYANTTFLKQYSEMNVSLFGASIGGSPIQIFSVGGYWNSTAAITQVVINAVAGNFVAGSVFSLYGQS
jgi:hypothetical protein